MFGYGEGYYYNCQTVWKWRKTIGETLARDLGINCYDRELMRLASDESGIAEGLFGKADEKLKNSPADPYY